MMADIADNRDPLDNEVVNSGVLLVQQPQDVKSVAN